jgi:anaerobic selenocysteine-containing dehydrogenase
MRLSRRQFVELLAGAGVSTLASSWLVDRVFALDAEGALPVAPGPGIESWAPTTCGLCPGGCGLEFRRIDGLPVGVRGFAPHPVNRGRLCTLPHAALQMLFSPDRVRRPLKRTGRRGQGSWEEIGWDDAEAMLLDRLRKLIRADSRTQLAFLDGRPPGLGRHVAAGFMRGVGSPHHVDAACACADRVGRRMFGWDRAPGADLENSRVILLFGFDHLETDGSPVWQNRVYAEGRGDLAGRPTYVSIGPRLLGSAAKSEHWLPARPGTEGIVAVAIAHVILEHRWQDQRFLEDHTDWAESGGAGEAGLHRLLTVITPSVAAEIAGVPAARIEETAGLFVEHQPGIALAGAGTSAAPTGALTFMAVNLLNVLVGAVGRRGTLVELPLLPLGTVWEPTADAGRDTAPNAITTIPQLTEALLENEPTPIDLLVVRGANPVYDTAMSRAMRRGLASYDRMIVVFAEQMTETALLADLVLPDATFLERWDMLTGTPLVPPGYALLQQPVIPPLFSVRPSEEVLARLCNSLGELSRVRFAETGGEQIAERASRGLFADRRGRLQGVPSPEAAAPAEGPEGFWRGYRASTVWAFDGIPASSRPRTQRIAMAPGRLLGLPEEPTPNALRELFSPRPLGVTERYPYQLSVFRLMHFRDGATTNLPMMMEQAGHWASIMWATWAEMHPRTAAEAHVGNGDLVRIASELGHIEVLARVSEATPPGIVAVPVGFGHTSGSTAAGVGANVNLILPSPLGDPLWELAGRVTRVNIVRA